MARSREHPRGARGADPTDAMIKTVAAQVRHACAGSTGRYHLGHAWRRPMTHRETQPPGAPPAGAPPAGSPPGAPPPAAPTGAGPVGSPEAIGQGGGPREPTSRSKPSTWSSRCSSARWSLDPAGHVARDRIHRRHLCRPDRGRGRIDHESRAGRQPVYIQAMDPLLDRLPTTLFVWSNGEADLFA
jgi:hypothetical protein